MHKASKSKIGMMRAMIVAMALTHGPALAKEPRTCEESLRVCTKITDRQTDRIADVKQDLRNCEQRRKEGRGEIPAALWVTVGIFVGTALGYILTPHR